MSKKKSIIVLSSIVVIVLLIAAVITAIEPKEVQQIVIEETESLEDIDQETEMEMETETEIETETVEDTESDYFDADEYYSTYADLIDSYPVSKSKNMFTESQVKQDVTDRNFTDAQIFYNYYVDGSYYEEYEVTDSDEKHPTYQFSYVSGNEVWNILVTNNTYTAKPVFYNAQAGLETIFVVSESEVVTSYDSVTNKFYETIPHESELIVKVVDKIDANTLDLLTDELLNSLNPSVSEN